MNRGLLQETGGIRDGNQEDRPIKGMTKQDPRVRELDARAPLLSQWGSIRTRDWIVVKHRPKAYA